LAGMVEGLRARRLVAEAEQADQADQAVTS
jgi:hypothetical protein